MYFSAMEIIFASQNKNKIKEINALVPETILVKGLDETIFTFELREDGDTLEANALQKHDLFLRRQVNLALPTIQGWKYKL